MAETNSLEHSERVLICAPFGRDAALILKEVVAAGLIGHVCDSTEEVAAGIREGAGVAVIADEALRAEGVECLASELAEQPPWSDFPLLVLTSGGNSSQGSRYRLGLVEPLGNVSLLERPLRTATLISSLKAALRARRHQYQIAAYLEEREEREGEMAIQNEELRKANRELEEFAFVSSHDLQEPLRMINIYTQMLVNQFAGGNADARKYARFVDEGVKRMERLLRDLLTYSRTIYGDTVTIETADLSKALSQAIATLNGRIEENKAEIVVGELPSVSGDEAQLRQVFQNLLSNALKYRHQDRSPRIVISAKRNGSDWVVSVSDNGIGFEQQYADRIFGLFKRLHKDQYPGTGLGLAICQRIVERCGGRIWAEAVPETGATFFIELPAADGVSSTAAPSITGQKEPRR